MSSTSTAAINMKAVSPLLTVGAAKAGPAARAARLAPISADLPIRVGNIDRGQRIADLVELERLDDRHDDLHRLQLPDERGTGRARDDNSRMGRNKGRARSGWRANPPARRRRTRPGD